MFEIFAATPENVGLDDVVARARRAEALGFDGMYVPDAVHDGMLMACQALAATRRLRVAISVLVAFPRSPMNVALAAWDLQRMSGGRFELGLGTQVRRNVEERYSARWLPPAAGMREYVLALRAIFRSFRSGEPLDFVGEHYRFTRLQPFFNPGPIEAGDVPLMLGAVGPRMLALAGEIADGLHAHPTSSSARVLRETILPGVQVGATRHAPGLAAPKICAGGLVATGADAPTVSRERERCRSLLAFLFSTPAYRGSLESHGRGEVGVALQRLAHERRWADMPALIDDELLGEFVVSAEYPEVAAALHARFDGLAARISFPLPENDGADAAIAGALADLRAGCR